MASGVVARVARGDCGGRTRAHQRHCPAFHRKRPAGHERLLFCVSQFTASTPSAERASVSGSSRRPPGSTIGTSRPESALLNPSTTRPHPSSKGRSRGARKISRFPYQLCTERCRRVPASLCGSEPNHRLTRSKNDNLWLWHDVGRARGSVVAQTALSVGPEPATETGDWRKR